ncbi:MAG: Vps62-related protein, partial [Candidatus Dependentiae bacterium]|nr:Vps62-related protein [Candidatus Dependentiae bacterium]
TEPTSINDGKDTENLASIIQHYAPIVWLQSGEDYFPMNASAYFTAPSTSIKNASDNQVKIPAGQVTFATMFDLFTQYFDTKKPFDLYFDIAACTRRGADPKQGDLTTNVYVVTSEQKDKIYLQYIYFYGYNGPYDLGPYQKGVVNLQGGHDPDIEHITIELDKNSKQPTRIFYGSTDTQDGNWLAWNDNTIEKSGTHPVAYAARYNHRFYPKMGTYVRMFGMANDITNQGTKWMPNNLVRLYPVADKRFDKNTMGWLYFPGIYGTKDNSIKPLGLQQWFANATWDIEAPSTAQFCLNIPVRDPKNIDAAKMIAQDQIDYRICIAKNIPLATALPSTQQQELQKDLNNLLAEAVLNKNVSKIQELLKQGADVNSKFNRATPLMFAAANIKDPYITALLLVNGADPFIIDDLEGKTAYQMAFEQGVFRVTNVFRDAKIWGLPSGDLQTDLNAFKAQTDSMKPWVNAMMPQTSCTDVVGLSTILKIMTAARFLQVAIPRNMQLKGVSWPTGWQQMYDTIGQDLNQLQAQLSQIQNRYKACDQAAVDATNKAIETAKAAADKKAADQAAADKAAADKVVADKIATEQARIAAQTMPQGGGWTDDAARCAFFLDARKYNVIYAASNTQTAESIQNAFNAIKSILNQRQQLNIPTTVNGAIGCEIQNLHYLFHKLQDDTNTLKASGNIYATIAQTNADWFASMQAYIDSMEAVSHPAAL